MSKNLIKQDSTKFFKQKISNKQPTEFHGGFKIENQSLDNQKIDDLTKRIEDLTKRIEDLTKRIEG